MWYRILVWSAIVVLLLHLGYVVYSAFRVHARKESWYQTIHCQSGRVQGLPENHQLSTRFIFNSGYDTLRVGWYGHHPDILADQVWFLCLKIKPLHGMANPGSRDVAWSWLAKGYTATAYVRQDKRNHLVKQVYGIDYARLRVRDWLWLHIKPLSHAGIFLALLIGDRTQLMPENWRVFQSTATGHLMAISGLHIGLVAMFTFIVMAWVGRIFLLGLPAFCAQRLAWLCAVITACLYGVMAGLSVSTLRAVVMAVLLWLVQQSGCYWSHWRIWLIVCIGMLLWQPVWIFSLSFWLSFVAVGCLIMVSYHSNRRAWWWRYGYPQWTICIGTSAIVLWGFGHISLLGMLVNVIAIPWMSFLVVPGAFISMMITAINVQYGEQAFALLNLVMDGLWQILARVGSWSWVDVSMVVADGWVLLSMLLASAVLLLPLRGIPKWWAGVLLLPLLFAYSQRQLPIGQLQVTVLDVGQGLAVVLQTQHHAMVYDTGPRYGDSDAGQRVILPYFAWRGVSYLDRLALSHFDIDHAGGAQSILDAMPVRVFNTPRGQAFAGRNDAENCLQHQSWQWDGVRFMWLSVPEQSQLRQSNARSCVLRVSVAKQAILLTGDIPATIEKSLVRHYGDGLRASVLVAPHHGSRNSSSPGFIQAVAPESVIFSSGFMNRFGFPHVDVVSRYSKQGVKLYNTAVDGALMLSLTKNKITIIRQRGVGHLPGANLNTFTLLTWAVLLIPMPLLIVLSFISLYLEKARLRQLS